MIRKQVEETLASTTMKGDKVAGSKIKCWELLRVFLSEICLVKKLTPKTGGEKLSF